MAKEYVEQRNGGYYVTGTRITLDSVVCSFLRGQSAEGIVESFPGLDLEQTYGAITFYLANRQAVDEYLESVQTEFLRLREEARQKYPRLKAKLEAARRVTPARP
jgi:uncharacterized protein (DUF433 family)